MKLKEIKKLTGVIECIGNLHIGGSKDTLEIGGMDNPVIVHPVTGEPYIPGSSLKGKMRCSVERAAGKLDVCTCGRDDCAICAVFGSSKPGYRRGPTRLIVRDAPLTPESRKAMLSFVSEKGKAYMGYKDETKVNRLTGTAADRMLRTIEFVPSGTSFVLNMSLLVYVDDEGKGYEKILKQALCAVEDTYLGGMGSRGYGQVEFRGLTLDDEEFDIRKFS